MSNPAIHTSNRRTVLVTGGSRGIGLECVKRFLESGDKVALTYSSSPTAKLHELKEEFGDALMDLRCNVTVPEELEKAHRAIEETLGGVEVFVANAGIAKDTLLMKMSDQDWNEVLDCNLTATWRTAKLICRHMIKTHQGRMIFISSVAGFMGSAGQANYAASKAGLMGLARSLAREFASRNVTVNVVAPGPIDTTMLADVGQKRIDELAGSIPLKRLGTPQEVASAVHFLASKDASYITGVVLAVDGGMSMGL
ncbi:MAG: 3-oxoacyl-ACP reductase FabG [Actinobacteria bacterium]|nr:3-oxoacyl-ACP reductase FabG [Actinomycetota bacterium]MCL6104400.1 3-oxoacyl-ACP reductase FabG [Actinomycetota bacterium]